MRLAVRLTPRGGRLKLVEIADLREDDIVRAPGSPP